MTGKQPSDDLDGRSILVVDECSAILRLAAEYLEQGGFEVVVARDGEEALARAEYVRPDFVLLDVVMPGIDGSKSVGASRRIDALRDVPVIFMDRLDGCSGQDQRIRVRRRRLCHEAVSVRRAARPREDTPDAAGGAEEGRKRRAGSETGTCPPSRCIRCSARGPRSVRLEDRYVLWNKRYAEIYAESGGEIANGMRFEDRRFGRVSLRPVPGCNRPRGGMLAARLARHAGAAVRRMSNALRETAGIRIEERRTADGGSVGIRIDITDLKLREESFRLLFDEQLDPDVGLRPRDPAHPCRQRCGCSSLRLQPPRNSFRCRSSTSDRRSRDAVRSSAATPDPARAEDRSWRHLKADGTPIDVSIYSRRLRYNGREASLIAAVDITERKRAEDELRNTREFLDTVVENVPTPIVVKNAGDRSYVLINRAAGDSWACPARRCWKTAGVAISTARIAQL